LIVCFFKLDFPSHLFQRDGTFQEVLPLGIGDLPALPHDLDAQHEAVDELVLLEEAAGHVDVGVEQDLVQQDLEAVFQHAALLRRLDGAVKELSVEEINEH